MKSSTTILLVGAVALNLGLTTFLLVDRNRPNPLSTNPAASSKAKPDEVRHLAQSLAGLRAELRDLQNTLAGTPVGEPGSESSPAQDDQNQAAVLSLADRLAAMETSIVRLQRSMDGISLESASAERDALFASEHGHLKADEYFAAEKYAIAGEGYLKFLQAHPDHPDHRNILQRARNSFSRAGYMDKALWAQEELMRIYPEHRSGDLMTLANMKKVSGNFAEAAQHAAESASLDQTSKRYWNLLYAAWYTELDQGPQAGLDYYRNVQQQIIDAGLGDENLGQRAQEKIEELERRIASANP